MIIVRHDSTERDYILLGTSYGMHKAKPQFHLKMFEGLPFVPGEYFYITVTDKSGEIRWLRSEDVTVVSVDGIKIKDLDIK